MLKEDHFEALKLMRADRRRVYSHSSTEFSYVRGWLRGIRNKSMVLSAKDIPAYQRGYRVGEGGPYIYP